jgi:uncharacterized membrane protein YphA (DoxX/SURF4 family)
MAAISFLPISLLDNKRAGRAMVRNAVRTVEQERRTACMPKAAVIVGAQAAPEQIPMITLGARVFGLGIVALALVCLAFGNFDFGQSVPKDLPGRIPLAYAAAIFMLLAGAAIEFRRTVKWGAAALAVYFGVVVVIVMDARVVVAHYSEYVIYSSVAAQLAVAAGALFIYAANLDDAVMARRLIRIGRLTFGVCAVLFGGAHFLYMYLTAPLVPAWLPPSQEFWGYATGVAHIAAGLALLTGVKARLAAILLTIMYASFTPLIHVPMVVADPSNHYIWSENALNLILTAVAWVVADTCQATIQAPQTGALT